MLTKKITRTESVYFNILHLMLKCEKDRFINKDYLSS